MERAWGSDHPSDVSAQSHHRDSNPGPWLPRPLKSCSTFRHMPLPPALISLAAPVPTSTLNPTETCPHDIVPRGLTRIPGQAISPMLCPCPPPPCPLPADALRERRPGASDRSRQQGTDGSVALGWRQGQGAGLGVAAAPPPTGPSQRPCLGSAHLPCRLSLSPHTLPAGGSPALLAQGQTRC